MVGSFESSIILYDSNFLRLDFAAQIKNEKKANG